MNSGKKRYITGLKGLACLSVMLGHYFGILSSFPKPGFALLEIIYKSQFYYLIRSGYWLQLFYAVSGYLVSKTIITSFSELVKKCIMRFLRFALPVFFVYMGLFVIDRTIGFHNADTVSIFTKIDYQQHYYQGSRSFMDYLAGPFRLLILNDCSLNGPYWVLHAMFLSSLYIYCMRYLKKYIVNDGVFFTAQAIIISFLMITDRTVYFGCLVGMLLGMYEDKMYETVRSQYFAFLILLAALLRNSLPALFIDGLASVFIILFVPRLRFLDVFLSSRPVNFLGEISWDIFSFHWPVLCSFGAVAMLKTFTGDNLAATFWAGLGVSILVTFAISAAYYFTFDKLTEAIMSFLKKKLFPVRPDKQEQLPVS